MFYAQGFLSLSTLIVHVRFQPWAIALAQRASWMEAVGSPGGAKTLQRAFRALTASPCPAEVLTPHPCALGSLQGPPSPKQATLFQSSESLHMLFPGLSMLIHLSLNYQ